jgi:perosamine synthetase
MTRGNAETLAINGGDAIVKDLPREVWPVVHDEDVEAVVRVLRENETNWNARGEVRGLEEEWAEFVGTEYAIGFSSGTASLHAAVCGAGVESGDEVICPAFTFLASASPIIHHQGIPVFVDVDPRTFNIAPDKIEAAITDRTRAIMVVHFHGLPADMDEINAIAERHGLVVIEDCSQAHAAEYKGRRVGGLGDVSGASIMAGKNLASCGEGGLLATDDYELRERAERVDMFAEMSRHGQPRAFNADTFGWNYRLPNVQAAFARSQLRRLDEMTRHVQAAAADFSRSLAQYPGLIPPHVPEDRTHAFHLYRFLVDPQAAGLDVEAGRFRQALQDVSAAEGLPLKHYQVRPLSGQRLFTDRVGYGKGCPWTCGHASERARVMTYDSADYPVTNDIIERSLIVGGDIGVASAGLGDPERNAMYVRLFEKIYDNLDEVLEHARELDYQAPWEAPVQVTQ